MSTTPNYAIEYREPKHPLPFKRIKIEDPWHKANRFNAKPDCFVLESLSHDGRAFEDHPWIIYPYYGGKLQKGIYMDDESARALAEAILHELGYNR